jgi:uncharacterized protein (DUF1778 family)
MSYADPGKIERIEIRTTPSIKRTLQWAAEATNRTVTDFLIEHGLAAAPDIAFSAVFPERKVERIVLRISPLAKRRLRELASAAGMSMTECLIDSGLKAAAHLQTFYGMGQW